MANDIWTPPTNWNTGTDYTEVKAEQEITDDMHVLSLAIDGDLSASTIKHRHLSGAFSTRPAAGEAGRRFYATDWGVEFVDNGTRWDPVGFNSRLCEHWDEEFAIVAVPLATVEGLPGWNWSGTGLTLALPSGNVSELALQVAAAGGNYGALHSGDAPMWNVSAARVPALLSARARTPANDQGWYLLGPMNSGPSSASNPTDGIYFRRQDGAGVGNWFAVTRAGGVETATDTTIAGISGYAHFEIEVTSTTQVKFYINGTLRATHTTNIPSANLYQFVLQTAWIASGGKEWRIDNAEWMARRL